MLLRAKRMQQYPVLLRAGEGEHVEADDAMSHVHLSVQCDLLQSPDQQISQMEQTLSRLLLSRLQNIQRSCQAH